MSEIAIVDYDPNWPHLFEEEAARLRSAIDQDLIVDIEHIGSTSVPGLAAKPVIDILVLVSSLDNARAKFVEPMQGLGYILAGANQKLNGMFFIKGISRTEDKRSHHVHITKPGQGAWQGLYFRKYLRTHPEEAARYAALKRELAERHEKDRFAYHQGKAVFINQAVMKAMSEGEL